MNRVTVDSLCTLVTSGGTPARSNPEFYSNGNVPWVKTGDLVDGAVWRYDEFITEEGLANSSAKLLPEHTILMAMYGATVGRLGWLVEPAACNQAACAMLVDAERCDWRWLFYALKWSRDELIGLASGAAQQNLNAKLIKESLVPAMDLLEQRAIAEVLGALDDKIAANRKAVGALLNLADAHFGHAVRDAATGSTTFGDVATVSGGGTPKTAVESYWGGNISWATPTDVTALDAPYLTRTSRTITDDGLAACASSLYPPGSILMTSRATIGAFAIAQQPTAVNQGFIVVNAHDADHQWWLFHEMKSRVPEFLSFANGATFLELPRRRFKELPVRTAASTAMADFGARVAPLHAAAVAHTAESVRLAATRDELLPLLMSGKIRVKDAEKATEVVL